MDLCSLRATKCPKARKEYGKDNESNQKCSLSAKLVPWKWNAPIWIAPTPGCVIVSGDDVANERPCGKTN